MITIKDLGRLLVEMTNENGLDYSDWLADNEIDEEAIIRLIDKMKQTFVFVVAANEMDVVSALESAIGAAFHMGWEAHKQFRSQTDPRGGHVTETPETPEPETPTPDEPPEAS